MEAKVASNDYRLGLGAHSPIVWLIVGLLLLGFWFIIQIIQVQTSEAFILGQNSSASLIPHLTILGQFVDILTGKMSIGQMIAFGYAWSSQVVFFVASLGTERALQTIHLHFNAGQHIGSRLAANVTWRARLLFALLAILTILDSVADILFANNLPWYSALLFAVAQFTVSFFIGQRAIHLIEAAFIDFRRPRAAKA